MAKTYNLVFSEPAAEYLLPLSKKRLPGLLFDLRKLAENPSVRSDYILHDSQGRPIEHLLTGDFVDSYWLDHPVQEIRIVDIADVS
jgi:hypothetical protein